jgi:DNA-binding NarL/FixJ family response regulator
MGQTDNRQPLRVDIAHRDAIVACGLYATLQAHDDLHMAMCSHADASGRCCDVIVCDLETGMAVARQASARGATPSVSAPLMLIFTSHISEEGIRQALALGVQGYVLSSAPLDELAHAVRTVASGQRHLSPMAAQRVAGSGRSASLTPREYDVLGWLGAGQCNKAIARQLGISVAGVKAHVKAIMGKLSAASRTQAVSIAARRGFIRWAHPELA